MLSIREFKQTYLALVPIVEGIVSEVGATPAKSRPGTAHIDRFGAIVQYVYYVYVVRKFLDNTAAMVLDWGGQHGQVTKLMSHYFRNTFCYFLESDSYDKAYGLKYWHSKLSINNVLSGHDPLRINLPDESADAVVSSGVLEHVCEEGVREEDALRDINRVLRIGGLFFVWNLPYKYGSIELLNSLLNRWHHKRRYSKTELVALLDSSGFEVVFVDHHEILNMMTRDIIGKVVGYDNAFILDYYLSKIPGVNLVAQHFTVVARKIKTL